jgi:hypothetical protein
MDGLFNGLTGFAGALLNAADHFIRHAVGHVQIVIREFGPLLFELAFGDIPVAFEFEGIHEYGEVKASRWREKPEAPLTRLSNPAGGISQWGITLLLLRQEGHGRQRGIRGKMPSMRVISASRLEIVHYAHA